MEKHKQITAPDRFGYQVRIVRRGVEYSKYFSHRRHGGQDDALSAAIKWRDEILSECRVTRTRFLKPPRNKTTTGVTGVSRTIKYDHRKDKRYLCYTVYWVNRDKPTNKSFQVGNVETISADDELHAFRTASLFRRLYEISIDQGTEFHYSEFQGWKNKRLYENCASRSVSV